jgi:hypothetical protein
LSIARAKQIQRSRDGAAGAKALHLVVLESPFDEDRVRTTAAIWSRTTGHRVASLGSGSTSLSTPRRSSSSAWNCGSIQLVVYAYETGLVRPGWTD